MKSFIITLSVASLMAITACGNNPVAQEKKELDSQAKMERNAVSEAIHDDASDFQQVDLVGNRVMYTHVYDGIIDIKTYTYDGDQCVEVERVYVFPDQMSALRHYRRAIEQVQLYDDIHLIKNEVKYDLKKEQYELETKSLNKEQLKEKFENQIKEVKADLAKHKKDCKGCK